MKTPIIREKLDLTYLNWTRTRGSSGTAGSFLKAYSELKGVKTYYKLSNYDGANGVVGHESVNEIIVDRLLSKLGIRHLHDQWIHADIFVDGKIMGIWLCVSEDFKKRGDSKVALDQYYNVEKLADETPLAFCLRQGWAGDIWKMLLTAEPVSRFRWWKSRCSRRDRRRSLDSPPSGHNESAALVDDAVCSFVMVLLFSPEFQINAAFFLQSRKNSE